MSIQIFGLTIPLYGIFFWLGIFAATAVAAFICKRRGICGFDLVSSAVYTMIMAIVGAKLLFIAVSMDDIITYAERYSLGFSEMLPLVLKGGFVFYGGLIGGLAGLALYCIQFKKPLWNYLDLYAMVLPLGHAIGRVGCFFAGCCYGIAYDGPMSHVYHVETGFAPVGVPLFPVQLAEASCLLLIFVILLFVYFRTDSSKHYTVFVYAGSYCIVRFALEFLRGDAERGALWIFSTSQWISLIIAAVASAYLIIKGYRNKVK